MAKLTIKQRNELLDLQDSIEQTINYIMDKKIAIARRDDMATTTLHYKRDDGNCLYEVNKEIGSPLANLYTALKQVQKFIDTHL